MRLDKFLIKQDGISRKQALQQLQQACVQIDGKVITQRDYQVTDFNHIALNHKTIQNPKPAHYFMMNKPAGVLSATKDNIHKTALDLIAFSLQSELHIAGRLDRASTGLLILTNDGRWSRTLTEPTEKIPKTYHVETVYAISPDTADLFTKGIYFQYEKITTSPAEMELLTENSCLLTIYEGRYHQIKRMFAAAGNRVKSLHRCAMGKIVLDEKLKPGEYRALTIDEIKGVG